MKLGTVCRLALAVLWLVTSSHFAWAGAIVVSGEVIAGKPITVKGSVGDTVSLYSLAAGAVCPTGAALPFSVGAAAPAASYKLTATSVKITPSTVLTAGELICVTAQTGAGAGAATPSAIMAVKAAPAASTDLTLGGTLTAPTTISVNGTPKAIVTLYLLVKPNLQCNKDGVNGAGEPLSFKVGAGALGTDFDLSDTTTVFTLNTPANKDDQLCLTAILRAGGSVAYAKVVPLTPPISGHVAPAQEPNFAHSFYTFGAVASNQLSTTNSTTAAQYVDFGWAFHWINEGSDNYAPGFNTSFSGRFTTMPVAAKTIPTPSPTTETTPFNILSTQESARIMASFSLPLRAMALTSYDESSGFPKAAIFLAPIARGSFSTLLNPTSTVAAPQGGTPSVQYAPTYNDWSLGGAVGLRHYQSDSRHEGIDTIARLDVSMGKFSNLQDIVCGKLSVPSGSGSTKAPANTSCYQTGTNTAGETTYDALFLNRKSIPRLELDGFYRIVPGPLVIGIDANLSQYSLFTPKNLDTLNRSGSDVRIYVGVTGSLGDLCTQLKLCKQ